jgi:hypothetical protein
MKLIGKNPIFFSQQHFEDFLLKFSLVFYFIFLTYGVVNAQWVQTTGLNGAFVWTLAAIDSNIFAGTYQDGVYILNKESTAWTQIKNGLPNSSVHSFCSYGTNIFAGTYAGVFRTINKGESWTIINNGLTDSTITSFALINSNLFAGTFHGGVCLSTNNGDSWTACNNGFNYYTVIYSLATFGNDLYAGTSNATGGGVFRSTNNGTSWNLMNIGLTFVDVTSFAIMNTDLFVGTSGGVSLSADHGVTWNLMNNGNASNLVVSGNNLFKGIMGGVFLSTDKGNSWKSVNDGLINDRIICITVNDKDLFVANSDGVFKRPLSDMITGVNAKLNNLPNEFSLQQNFPNPFNPTTTIKYSVSKSGFVTIKVYDLLSREVTTLVNENKPIGNYSVQFNASILVSGIYFYRMKTGDFVQTKKLILLK